MKLVYPEWEHQIVYRQGVINVVQIERADYLTTIVEELITEIQTGNGRFVLSEEDIIKDMKKSAECIVSPFMLNLQNKRFLTAIFRQLEEIADNEEYIESQTIKSELKRFVAQLAQKLDYRITFQDNVSLIDLFKALEIKLDTEEGGILDRLVEYILLANKILGINVFILVKLKSYFVERDILRIYKTISEHDIFLIDIEGMDNRHLSPMEEEFIIDNDLCELHSFPSQEAILKSQEIEVRL